jgi:hypothetical protein
MDTEEPEKSSVDFAEGEAFNTINSIRYSGRYFGTRRSEARKMFMMVFDV